MIRKYYEVSCDRCGQADFGIGTIAYSEWKARQDGWIITKDKKHYCCKECKNAVKQSTTI